MDADEPQLRHLRDILGAYARQILGWYSIADDRDDDEDDAGRGITYGAVRQSVEFNQRRNRTPEAPPHRATESPAHSRGWG